MENILLKCYGGKNSKFRLAKVFLDREHLNCLVAMVTCVMGGHVMDCEGDQQFERCRNWLKLDLTHPVLLTLPGERSLVCDVMDNGIGTIGAHGSHAQSHNLLLK